MNNFFNYANFTKLQNDHAKKQYDAYHKQSTGISDYLTKSFTKPEELTTFPGYLSTFTGGVGPSRIATESRLRNINIKNKDYQQINAFDPTANIQYKYNNFLGSEETRTRKSCTDYPAPYAFTPNLKNPQAHINARSIGLDTRHENR